MRYLLGFCMGACLILPFGTHGQTTEPTELLRYRGQHPREGIVRDSQKSISRVAVDDREGPNPKLLGIITHKKQVYVNDKKQVHVALSAPLFLRLALSPDDNDPTYLLHGNGDTHAAVPFYLDKAGKHRISHVGGQGVPGFTAHVYADDMAPVSTLQFTGATMYAAGGPVYFGKGLKATIRATDDFTGLQTVYYTLQDSVYIPFKDPISFDEQNTYRLRYYAVDNVGNSEAVAELTFTIDISSPTIDVKFSGPAYSPGETPVYAVGVSLEMEARDALSGLARLAYALNDEPEKLFERPLRFETRGDYTIVIRAADHVGNPENQILRFKVN